MKKIIFISFLVLHLFLVKNVIGQQCCPYVQPIIILPTNPLATDNIKAIINVSTPDLGFKLALGYTFNYNQSSINITGCYYDGVATQPVQYIDTINFGKLPLGNYSINFTAYMSNSLDSCIHNDSNIVTQQFSVTLFNKINEIGSVNEFNIYPNYVTNRIDLSSINVIIDELAIYNIYGQQIIKIKNRTDYIDIVDLSEGIYFIVIKNKEKSLVNKFVKGK